MGEKTETPVSKLPARPPLDGEFGPVPDISEISVGDLVAIYSRGAERVAMVEKVGRSRLGCIYTTKGAWDTAQKTHESLTMPGGPERAAAFARQAAAKNWDYYVRESDAATAVYAVASSWRSEEQAAAERRENAARVESTTKDEYIAQEAERARARRQEELDDAVARGIEGFVHITRKDVPLADVIGWKKAS